MRELNFQLPASSKVKEAKFYFARRPRSAQVSDFLITFSTVFHVNVVLQIFVAIALISFDHQLGSASFGLLVLGAFV